MKVWLCLVRGRAFKDPSDPTEYVCVSRSPSGEPYLRYEHKEAGCGIFEKVD